MTSRLPGVLLTKYTPLRRGLPAADSLRGMGNRQPEKSHRTVKGLWLLALAIVSAIAIVQELRKPPEKRTWHGKIADLLPYDLRKPTIERFREASWNPDGPILSSKAWGFGWTPNFGAIKKLFGV
jgi:hypothetical protein